jgi:hypothetical protein
MFSTTKQLRSLSYKMKKVERIHGVLDEQISTAKIQCKPFKVYTKQLAPKYGIEVLYVEGQMGNHALVNPNGFPWVNLKLDPYGSVMRKNQHHTLLNAGYAHVVSILEYLFNKYGEETKKMTTITTDYFDGQECWKLVFKNPYFKYEQKTFSTHETVQSYADKHKLSAYMLLELNPGLGTFDASLYGKTIKTPNDYSPSMILMIDKKRMVPLFMEVHDDKGLFEKYEYTNVVLNPTFKDEEFSEHYGEYGF